MKKKYLSQRIRHSLRHMRLSDRCLCLFLLLQSAWHIFLPPDLTKEFDAMDAMIRSSAATIFWLDMQNMNGHNAKNPITKCYRVFSQLSGGVVTIPCSIRKVTH